QYFLLDNEPVWKNFETYDQFFYKLVFSNISNTIILDEIHLLSNPGRAAKIIFDQFPDKHLIITGSSALNIKNKTAESLAGRKIEYHLYPLTFAEYLEQTSDQINNYNISETLKTGLISFDPQVLLFNLRATLERILTYGLYPYLVEHPSDTEYLLNLSDSVIFKDILELDLIENRKVALDLLKLLAHQIGNLINYAELSRKLNIDTRTVKKYIEIFEQSYIIFRLYPFSKNARDEIGKSPKIYFHDLGLRNALINDFSSPFLRRDSGAIFENFIICEFYKLNDYLKTGFNLNFWRTSQGSEVDLVLSQENKSLVGLEIKLSKGNPSRAFAGRYKDAQLGVITSENFY
ncbi:ATP-binding protein, partial [Candidatus Amesbacteria bacterium]|nr:ATP-binding protein [Candidatus Amesbacteria bacterium]